MGQVSTHPSSNRRKRSGDEDTTAASPSARWAANGAGLSARRRRKRSKGVIRAGRLPVKRWARFT